MPFYESCIAHLAIFILEQREAIFLIYGFALFWIAGYNTSTVTVHVAVMLEFLESTAVTLKV